MQLRVSTQNQVQKASKMVGKPAYGLPPFLTHLLLVPLWDERLALCWLCWVPESRSYPLLPLSLLDFPKTVKWMPFVQKARFWDKTLVFRILLSLVPFIPFFLC